MSFARRAARAFDARRRLVAAALVGWGAVVMVAAGADPATDAWVGIPDGGSVMAWVFVVLCVLGAVTWVLAWTPGRRRRSSGGPLRGLVAVAIGLAIGAAFAFAFDRDRAPPTIASDSGDAQVSGESVADSGLPGATAGDVALLVAVAVVAGGVVLWSRHHGPVPPDHPLDGDLAEDLGSAIDRALILLDPAHDPRTAILRAYAELEAVLAHHGLVRAASDTAAEHLLRAMAELPVDEAGLGELGELYDRARFSSHPLTEEDRWRAVVQLEAAHEALTPVGGPTR